MRIAIGTRKGLWTAHGGSGDGGSGDGESTAWEVSRPHKDMAEFSSVAWVPREAGSPRLIVGARSWFWGPSILFTDDDGVTWSEPTDGAISFPEDTGAALERVWTLEPEPGAPESIWAGCEPHSLWHSTDGGAHFSLVRELWEHPHRAEWHPGAGGPAIHTVVPQPDGTMAVAMSTGGVYRTDPGSPQWRPANQGIRVDFSPEEYPAYGQCVHRLAIDADDRSRFYVQNHGGVFRSTDGGDSWSPITEGLPADFGFVVLAHPTRSGTIWVIPIDSETMFPPGGELRVWRSDDAGDSWRRVGAGLPSDAYVSVLRDAAHVTPYGDDAAIAFGTRNGCVYASLDGGETFTEVVHGLPDVLSVRAIA